MSNKIFVLDTSVILHDPTVISKFKGQLVAIPITVLEELDGFKKGNDFKGYSSREFIRFIDKISISSMLQNWVPTDDEGGKFRIVYAKDLKNEDARVIYDDAKNDNRILNAALTLKEEENKEIVLVSKDIALRVKARALNIKSEDYEN